MNTIKFDTENSIMRLTNSLKPAHRATSGGGGKTLLGLGKRFLAKIFGAYWFRLLIISPLLRIGEGIGVRSDVFNKLFIPHPNLPLFFRGRLMKKAAFTLAEVLITLGIIGVVAAMTIPVLMSNIQKAVFRESFKKKYAVLVQAYKMVQEEMQTVPECGYWLKSPYNLNSVCANYDDKGNCTSWKMSDGSDMPSDINDVFPLVTYYDSSTLYLKGHNISIESGCVRPDDIIKNMNKK